MANRRHANQKKNPTSESALSSARTDTPNIDNSSRTGVENQELSRRIDLLEQLLNNRFGDQNTQVKRLEEKVQQLEDQVTQYKTQVESLEDKITSLQNQHPKENETKSVVSSSVRSDTVNQAEAVAELQPKEANDSTVPPKKDLTDEKNVPVTHKIVLSDPLPSTTNADSRQQISHLAKTTTHQKADGEFVRWMCSRSLEESVWSSDMYQRPLLNYLAKIYGQKDRVYAIFNDLQWDMRNKDELDILHALIERVKYQIGAKRSLCGWEKDTRPEHRIRELSSIFEYSSGWAPSIDYWEVSSSMSNGEEIINGESVKAYFDLLCRSGSVTPEIGKYFQLKKENIFGGNDYDPQNKEMTFVHVDPNQSIINLVDNRVDLITCLVTLHHVTDLNSMLRELVRILRPGGHLILREHDCKGTHSIQAKYLNFIHAIMRIAKVGEFAQSANQTQDAASNSTTSTDSWEQEKRHVIDDTISIQYRTHAEWQQELKRVGFRHKATFEYNSNSPNPQALFFAVYQLPSK